ncbi:MAG TPA: radical SAM protein [Bradyrhizobium sp.]|uniref:B12-binding domain-containing radical SAM protein n=1 Tax=Bradyrhizobium sp. TaxID=376 RepID=UPI002D7FE2A4|nr:radical SAM protein [Bradyrhizobium sp.]HET7887473.1 radical SAM protein [Bradyrhizobium sp.]
MGDRRFVVELIKPSHYDDDGYVIQWWKSWIPSNSLACLYGIATEIAARRALGDDVTLEIRAYDECHTVIPVRRIIQRIKAAGAGLVCFVGVQSNQFPRAMDLAMAFREAGVAVAIGGFHVSGCLAMLPDLPHDLKQARDSGIALFAGEAEGRLEGVFRDALAGRLLPIYNYMDELPGLQRQVTPFLPIDIVRRYGETIGAFDAGRGCPFQCSFCTIINVQGRKSRWRDADDVERLVRANLAQGVFRFFITDDNFARNRNWEAIFDRLIAMREQEGLRLQFIIQVDTLCHRIPNFVDKAARAGCKRVFIGLENVNSDNLLQAKKRQNRVHEYRRMFHEWRTRQVITYAGYILGFPSDTPERIAQDIATVQRELPVDLLEFFILTPLPGSADHQALDADGVWMDSDMNKYDLEHVTTGHPVMTAQEWQRVYRRAWDLYYSKEHIETIFRRAKASGIKPVRLLNHILQFYFTFIQENVHPLQGGYFRRKLRRSRRSGLPRENPLVFYPRRVREVVETHTKLVAFYLYLHRIRRRVERDRRPYTDLALAPVAEPVTAALARPAPLTGAAA